VFLAVGGKKSEKMAEKFSLFSDLADLADGILCSQIESADHVSK
jgi:hypothetical protein